MILLLFDIDGTILRMKHGISKKVFSDNLYWLFEQNIDDGILPDFHGMTDLQIVNDIAEKIHCAKESMTDKLPQFWENLNKELTSSCTAENTELMPGIPDLLEALSVNKHYVLGLLTGNIKSNAYSKLSSHNLDRYFETGAFGNDHMHRSELPSIAIRRANKFYGTNEFGIENSMLIGDSVRDIEAAKSNHLPILSVSTGGIPFEELSAYNPDYLFKDLHNTELIIETLNKHFNIN